MSASSEARHGRNGGSALREFRLGAAALSAYAGAAVVLDRDGAVVAANGRAVADLAGGKFGFLTSGGNTVGGYLAGAIPGKGGKNAAAMLAEPLKAYVVLHAEPLDDVAAKAQKGLRIFVRDDKPLDSIARRLESGPQIAQSPAARAEGEVTLVMMLDLETEVEMRLPGRFRVSPQIAGAIKAVAGVVDVQTV